MERGKVMPHTYGVELEQFTNIRDNLIKEIREVNEYASGAETDEENLELAIACLGRVISDAKWFYEMTYGNQFYNIDKRRYA